MAGAWKEIYKRKVIYTAVAAALFLACIFLTRASAAGKDTNVRIVCLGDSILAQARDQTSVTALLQEKLGVTAYNGAFGGTCMGKQDKNGYMHTKDSFSMAALSQSMAYNDFGPQNGSFIKDIGTDYYTDTLDGLKRIDLAHVDILLIEHGTNDYNAGIPIYNEADPFDVYSFAGALRSSVRVLQEKYPDLRIILMLPTFSWHLGKGQTCEEWYSGYGYLEDYVEAGQQVAREYGIELIDTYHGLYPHETWEDWALYTTDGLHPNEAGRELLAETLARYLKEHPDD